MRAWPMVRHRLALAGLLALGAPAGSAMAQDAPREHIGPFADIDWSLGLRGSYAVSSSTGGAAELQVLPELSWTRQGGSTKSVLGVGGQFAVSPAGTINIDDAHGTAEGQWMLGPETTLTSSRCGPKRARPARRSAGSLSLSPRRSDSASSSRSARAGRRAEPGAPRR